MTFWSNSTVFAHKPGQSKVCCQAVGSKYFLLEWFQLVKQTVDVDASQVNLFAIFGKVRGGTTDSKCQCELMK